MTRIERVISPLPRECSTTEPHGLKLPYGAEDGARTRDILLGRQVLYQLSYFRYVSCGEGWIRTNVGASQQIYSLPPLATRAPLLFSKAGYCLSKITICQNTFCSEMYF